MPYDRQYESWFSMDYTIETRKALKGWYIGLFKNDKSALKFKPNVCTMQTSPNDDAGEGGNVHLGTANVNLLYVIYKGVAYIGPCASAYEFITEYNTRLNDEEWKTKYVDYKPIEL